MPSLRKCLVMAAALPALVGCASVQTTEPHAAVHDCLESVSGPGDLHDRAPRIGTGCRPPEAATGGRDRPAPGPSEAADSRADSGADSGAIVGDEALPASPSQLASPSESASPSQPAPLASSSPRPSAPAPSLSRGARSPAGPGTYILWIKDENHVYLVSKGVVTRVMVTTGLPWKTPSGTYKVKYKARNSSSLDEGHAWTLPYFVAFWRRPGADGDIAFHQVPHDARGRLEQPVATLGQPGYRSEGCNRMAPADARAIWDFAEVGTPVVVR